MSRLKEIDLVIRRDVAVENAVVKVDDVRKTELWRSI